MRKRVYGGLTALCVLAIAAVGFTCFADGVKNTTNDYLLKEAKATQNTFDWAGEIVSDEGNNDGTATYDGEGFTFNVTKNTSKTDWHVKLTNYSLSLKQYETYKIQFDISSTVASEEGKGAVINVNGGATWEKRAIVVGNNTIEATFLSSNETASVELQLGQLGVGTFVVKNIVIIPLNNLLEGFEAAAWNDTGYTSSVTANPAGVNYASFSVANASAGDSWNVKLQALTTLTLETGKEYRIHYQLKTSVDASGLEVLHGTRDAEWNYSEKWSAAEDGWYGVNLTAGTVQTHTFTVTPAADITKVVISVRAGTMTTGTVELMNVYIVETADYWDNTSALKSNLESAEHWKAAWAAVRASEEKGLCKESNRATVTDLIERYDNLTPSVRNSFKDTVDADEKTYAQSIEYFRDRLA